MMLKEVTATLDVFKGRKSKSGQVVKVRSVGCGYRVLIAYGLQINGFNPDSHVLIPEADVRADNDYVIYHRSPHIRGLRQVGVGYLMSEGNAGIIQLEWDVYGNNDIYLNLSKLAAERRAA